MPHFERAAVAAAAVSAGLLATAVGTPALASGTENGYAGHAYGSAVTIGSLVNSGPSASVTLCSKSPHASHTDKTAAVTIPTVGKIGAVTTRVSAQQPHPGVIESLSTSHTAVTTLLAGVVSAKAIDTRAAVKRDGSTYRTKGAATFVGLKIAGKAVPSVPSTNKSFAIPGVGSIVLNQQHASAVGGVHTLAVTALTLTIGTSNNKGLPAGKVVIGRAVASLHAPVHHFAYGSSYSTAVEVGGVVKSGRTAPARLPCAGISRTETNATAATTVPSVVTGGAATDKAVSADGASATDAATSSRIAHVSLLGGAITADGVIAQAHAVRRHGTTTTDSSGTAIATLTIDGKSYSIDKPTTQKIPGLGTLYLERSTRTKTGITVHAIELVLGSAHGKFPAGAHVIVGSASAGVRG